MREKKRLTPLQALQNAKIFCAYQERSHAEVKERLYSVGLQTQEVENIVSQLIEGDYLNEERFARAFVRGKFRMKKWGRVKIRYELKQRQVSEFCIRKGMTEIDDEEYMAVLSKLAEEKIVLLKREKNIYIKRRKLSDYLLQKGFERDLISGIINEQLTK